LITARRPTASAMGGIAEPLNRKKHICISMELAKTVVCKLKPTDEEREKLLRTVQAFKDACNHISKVAFDKRVFNPVALHHLVYRETRAKFGLPANLAIRARDRVAKAYKQRRDKLLRFDRSSLDLDARLFRLIDKPDGVCASISTVQKRVKPPLAVGEHQRKLLRGAKPTHAVLTYKNGCFYLHLIVERKVPEPNGSNPVGVDVGMNNLLVASNGFRAEGKSIAKRREHFRRLRSSLQAKGTKSAKRRLKRLGGREKRWANTVLHQVSKRFVDSLKPGDIVVLEDLNGIRNRVKLRKSRRAGFHSWAFARLQSYIRYKALERGIPVISVDARNTSITCPRCGHAHRNNRRSQSLFRCMNCGFQHNADWVASLNLARRAGSPGTGRVVNRPDVRGVLFNHFGSPRGQAHAL
jgi:putative transposase